MKKIAIIGAGVAGLTCAYLLSKKYQVKIFEKNNYFGGHTNTVNIANTHTKVDTGFIVLNNKTYPNFHKLLSALNVSIRNTDMSFGYSDQATGFAYSGKSLNSLFANRANLTSIKFYKLLSEILRFCKISRYNLKNNKDLEIPLSEYLNSYKFTDDLIYQYLLPISSAIWSTEIKELFNFPTITLLRFFQNHGLLQILDRPQWQTVVGGSQTYVEKIIKAIEPHAIKSNPVKAVIRHQDQIEVISQESEYFDNVIFATHADQVLSILENPTVIEQQLLSVWKYNNNPTTLHSDQSLLPSSSLALASWNFIKIKNSNRVIISYDMNNLMGLESDQNYIVSLNSDDLINPNKKIASFNYTHPCFDLAALESQKKLPYLNGADRIWYCGSYFGYGFHEDAVKSALEVTKDFNCNL